MPPPLQNNPFRVGDTVKRKTDNSPRTRVVTQITDEFIYLDRPLDGWAVWNWQLFRRVEADPVAADAPHP